jgi:hypothetical protein
VDASLLLFLGGQNSLRKKSNPRQSFLSQTTHWGNNLALLLSSLSASSPFCPLRTQYVYFKTVLTVSNYMAADLSHTANGRKRQSQILIQTWTQYRLPYFPQIAMFPAEAWRSTSRSNWLVTVFLGRAWFPTASAKVRAQLRSCGICGGQSGTGTRFLRVLRVSLLIITPIAAHALSSIIRGWYNSPNSDWRTKSTQSHPSPRNLKTN